MIHLLEQRSKEIIYISSFIDFHLKEDEENENWERK